MRVPGYTQDVCGGPSAHGRYGYVDEENGLAECDDCGIEFKVPRDQRKRDADLEARVRARAVGIPASEFVDKFKREHPAEWAAVQERGSVWKLVDDETEPRGICSNCGGFVFPKVRHSCGLA
jgi:hypothetical protein